MLLMKEGDDEIEPLILMRIDMMILTKGQKMMMMMMMMMMMI